MRCGKARDWVSLEIDGDLPPDGVPALEQHLAGCDDCRGYRDDLRLGRRILAASAPQLSDEFDWRLRLRLNRALTEAAREAAAPWPERRVSRGAWVQRFGLSAAVGLAAVLAVALFVDGTPDIVGPQTAGGGDRPEFRHLVPTAEPAAQRGASLAEGVGLAEDRLSLSPLFAPGGGALRTVANRRASALPTSGQVRQQLGGWTGDAVRDLATITELRQHNDQLETLLRHREREIQMLKARLDTSQTGGLDLRRSR
jgi:hypothetical protein